MEGNDISQDDLTDVREMTRKIENYVCTVLEGNQRNLAMSALMSSAVNCMLKQCDTLRDVMAYRGIFISVLDCAIRSIEIKGPDQTV